jgi:glucokinase
MRGITGEFGHLPLEPEDGPLCGCGRRGCLEAFVGRSGILDIHQRLCLEAGTPPPDGMGIQELGRLADEQDEPALRAFALAGKYLGRGLAILVNLLNPELIVLGGGVARTGEPLLGPALRAMHETALPACMEDVRIELTALGDDAGILGAACAARQVMD